MADNRGKGKGGGSVYQDKQGRWWAAVEWGYTPAGRRRRKRKLARNPSHAERLLREMLTEREKFGATEPTRETVAKYLERWQRDVVAVSTRTNTVRAYTWAVGHIVKHLGKVRLQDLTQAQVQAMVRALGKSLGPRSVYHVLTVLNTALEYAEGEGTVKRNVAAKVARPRVEEADHATLTEAQARHFLAAARDDRFFPAYVFGLTTTLRVSEVCGLRWSDVDFTRSTLTVNNRLEYRKSPWRLAPVKSKAGRHTIWLPPATLALLRQHRGQQLLDRGPDYQDHGFILATSKGTPVSPTNMTRRYLKGALAKAGLPPMSFHALRHTASTLLAEQGVHPSQIQHLMGHSSPDVALNVYTHISPEASRAASEMLGRLLGGEAE